MLFKVKTYAVMRMLRTNSECEFITVQNFYPDQVFSTDETGLYRKFLPSKSLEFTTE